MKEEIIYWNKGEFKIESELTISLLSPTSQFGLNVFEGIRCYKNKDHMLLFRLNDHIDRLYNSANQIGVRIKESKDELKKIIISLIKKNNFSSDIILRVILYVDQKGSWSQNYDGEILVIPKEYNRAYEKKKSLNLYLSKWERINENSMPPTIKCGANYINSRLAHLDAVKNGFDTALLINNNGTISESTGACFFGIKNNKLITPPISSSILDSITRKTIIQISKELLNINTEIREVELEEIELFEEIFLCGTSIEIFPVAKINKKQIGNNKAGILTSKLQEIYFSLVRGGHKNYNNWITQII